jgi:hypothetical protein
MGKRRCRDSDDRSQTRRSASVIPSIQGERTATCGRPHLLHDPPARSEDGTGDRRAVAPTTFRVGHGFVNALEYACAIEDDREW